MRILWKGSLTASVEDMKKKGLPKYSIKGGICNEKGCLNICTTLIYDGIWRCEKHAREKVKGFINAYKSIGGVA